MPGHADPQRGCRLCLHIDPGVTVESKYDPKTGLRQSLRFGGHVHHPWVDGPPQEYAEHFHGKPAFLQVHAPSDPDSLENILESIQIQHDVVDVCGVAEIYADVRPKRHQCSFAGGEYEIEPVQIRLFVDPEAFSSILRQVIGNSGRPARVTLGLVGDRLPKKGHRLILLLEDLDVSTTQEYAVGEFEIVSSAALPSPAPIPTGTSTLCVSNTRNSATEPEMSLRQEQSMPRTPNRCATDNSPSARRRSELESEPELRRTLTRDEEIARQERAEGEGRVRWTVRD